MSTLAAPVRQSGFHGLERANSVVWSEGTEAQFPKNLLDTVLEGFEGPVTYESIHKSFWNLREAVETATAEDSGYDVAAKLRARIAAWFARSFLLGRPLDIPAPEIDVWESGKIAFEWYKDPRRIVTATFDDKRKLVFSMLLGEERMNGVLFVGSEWPDELTNVIKRVMSGV